MRLQRWLQDNKAAIKRVLDAVGYDHRLWARVVMYEQCFALLRGLGPERLDALEISAGPEWRTLGFRTFTTSQYPDFDVCSDVLAERFDVVIADQIFEHVLWPARAARNVHAMLRPGGHFLVTVPFMIRMHREPQDCTRWSETGLRHFLAECGFPLERIRTGAWGNRACVKANFGRWARRGWFGSLENEPDFPVAVWALAQRAE
jgi:SAM-dependent methyltransferase